MAVNGIYNDMNYYRFMNKLSDPSSKLSVNTANNVNKLVSSQLDSTQALQNMLSSRFSKYQSNLEKFSTYQKDAKSFYTDFAKNASNLKSSALNLRDAVKGNANPSGAASTNSGVLSVKGGTMLSTDKMDVSVSRIATSQTSKSKAFSSNMGYTLGGKSSVEITAKGKTTSLSFNISQTTSNKDALTQIAGQINSAKLGVTASVETKNGMSSLSVMSSETGSENAFETKFTGSLEKLAVQNTSNAQDAQYSVNGKEFTSSSNNVKLGDSNLTATLEGTGNAAIKRGAQDTGKTLDTLKEFANDYNETVKFLNKNASKSEAISNLAYSYGTTKFQATSLAEVGVTTKSDGSLSINEEKFKEAMQNRPDTVKTVLQNLAQSTSEKTQKAIVNSATLYSAPKLDSTQGSGGVYNAYNQFMQNPNAGMNLFNLML